MMTHRIPKNIMLFIALSGLVIAIVIYLGSQTIAYQALKQQNVMREQGELALSDVDDVLSLVLRKEEQQLMNAEPNSISQRFIIDNGSLIYPDATQELSRKEHSLLQKIEPIVDNVFLLDQAYLAEGQSAPSSGWYIQPDHDMPLWIYWMKHDRQIIGYSVSYPYLVGQLFNHLIDGHYPPKSLITIEDNGQLLFQSSANEDATTLYATRQLSFPLNYWQLKYYAEPYNAWLIYALGSSVIAVLCVILAWLFGRLFQEYQRIQNLARQQVNFVSQVSHELKTPLTNISLFAELLQEEALSQDSRKYSEIILNESQRLTRLIQNILSFTKAREPILTTFDLVNVIHDITRTFQPSFEMKGLHFNVTLPTSYDIHSDKDAITQILMNLISNAEKYGASGKVVDICLDHVVTGAIVSIRDYGEGIANKHVSQIFKPFYRVHSKITEGVAGTGIGLTIAQQLAESIESSISVHPKNDGVEFCVHLTNLKSREIN